MYSQNNNLVGLPIDMLIVIMKMVLLDGFEGFFSFLKALAQTKRVGEIIYLLEQLPVRELYKFRLTGTESDASSFDRFFTIGEYLRISDAVLYARCRDIMCGVGRLDVHLMELEGLASRGHFLSMVASFVLRTVHKQHNSSASVMEGLLRIHNHPYHATKLLPALNDLQRIKAVVPAGTGVKVGDAQALCPIHPSRVKPINMCSSTGHCAFCNIAWMLNVFANNVAPI